MRPAKHPSLLSTLPASARFPRLVISLRLPEDSCSWGTQGLPEALAARGCSWSGVGEQRARAGHPPPLGPHPHCPGCANQSSVIPAQFLCPDGKGNTSNSQAKLQTTNDKQRAHAVGVRVYSLWRSSWACLGETLNGIFAVCSSVSESCCGWSHAECD